MEDKAQTKARDDRSQSTKKPQEVADGNIQSTKKREAKHDDRAQSSKKLQVVMSFHSKAMDDRAHSTKKPHKVADRGVLEAVLLEEIAQNGKVLHDRAQSPKKTQAAMGESIYGKVMSNRAQSTEKLRNIDKHVRSSKEPKNIGKKHPEHHQEA